MVRTAEESFTTTARRVAGHFDVVVNGGFYDVSDAGKRDASFGSDPIAASATTIQGPVVRGTGVIGANGAGRFHIAQTLTKAKRAQGPPRGRFITGRGGPPVGRGTVAASGDAGPLISNRLP